jgi:hypothetical protein
MSGATILLRNGYFLKKYIEIIFLNFFFILSHQNNTKTSKNINLNERKKNSIFLKYFLKANTDML